MSIDKIKSEIRRIEDIMSDKHSYFIRKELKQYLKMLRQQLKEAERD